MVGRSHWHKLGGIQQQFDMYPAGLSPAMVELLSLSTAPAIQDLVGSSSGFPPVFGAEVADLSQTVGVYAKSLRHVHDGEAPLLYVGSASKAAVSNSRLTGFESRLEDHRRFLDK